MPGVQEISKLIQMIQNRWQSDVNNNNNNQNNIPKLKLLPLHSALSSKEQKDVFEITGKNELKIIISTNIAEVSTHIVTII